MNWRRSRERHQSGLAGRLREEGARPREARNHSGEIVLIVGHDNTVPAVIKALNYPLPVTIGSTEFDRLFQAIPRKNGQSPALLQIRHYAD